MKSSARTSFLFNSPSIIGYSVEVSGTFHKTMLEALLGIPILDHERIMLGKFKISGGNYLELAHILEGSPSSQAQLLETVHRLLDGRVFEPVTSVVSALGYLGFEVARNWIAATMITNNRKEPGGHLSGGSLSQRPPLDPMDQDNIKDILKFALAGEASAPSPELASCGFVGGLFYDILRAHLRGGRDESVLTQIWTHGLAVGDRSVKLLRDLHLDEIDASLSPGDAYFDAIIHDIGVFLMPPGKASQSPSPETPEFLAREESEVKNQRFSHALVSDLVISSFPFARESRWVALYHHRPFLAIRLGPKISRRTTLLWLADRSICQRDADPSRTSLGRHLAGWHAILQDGFNHRAPGLEPFREVLSSFT